VQLEIPDIGTSTEDLIEEKHSSIQLFPNPVLIEAQLQINLQESADMKISIYNLLGAEVLRIEERPYPEGKQLIDLDLEVLKSGVYFCNITTEQFSDTIKFVKQ
jgi:hypothetical protein